MDPVLKKGAVFNPSNLDRDRIFATEEDQRGNPLPPPDFYWCLHCERTYRRGEYRQVNDLQMCPYAGCDGDAVLDAWSWNSIQRDSPYPERPLEGVVYPIYRSEREDRKKPSRPDFTNTELEALLSTAFIPYQCSAKIDTADKTLKFEVYESGRPIIGMTQIGDRRFSDKKVRSLISQARKQLTKSGYKLKPWRFPERSG